MLINASSTYAYERRVFIQSVILAVVLHIGVLGFLVAGHLLFSVKPVQPAIMSVGLASATSLKGPGGKKTKAPVMRKRKAPPKKKVVQHKKKTTRKKKPRKNEVGLNTKKKTRKKNRPAQAKEDTNPVVENPGKRVQTGGTGGAADSGISFEVGGGQEGTAVQDLPYLAYLQTIQMELSQRWARAGLSGGVTTITFRINRDGSIQDAEISESSGKRYLDGPALRAVLGARLPPLPQGCMDDYLVLHYQFHY